MKKYSNSEIRVFDAFCVVARENEAYGKVTLSKIAEEMGISRQALTKSYFRDLEEIIVAFHNYVDQDVSEKMRTYVATGQKELSAFLVTEIFPLLYRKRKYLRVLYGEAADPSWPFYVVEKYSQLLFPYFSESIKRFNLEPTFVTRSIVCIVFSAITDWLSAPEPEKPELFGEKFLALMEHSFIELVNI